MSHNVAGPRTGTTSTRTKAIEATDINVRLGAAEGRRSPRQMVIMTSSGGAQTDEEGWGQGGAAWA